MPRDATPEATQQMEQMLVTMVGLVVTSCKDDQWSAEAIHCGLTAKDPDAGCDRLLTAEQQQKMQDRMMKAMGTVEGTLTVAGNTGIAECDAYAAAANTYLACDKIPLSARDAMKQGFDLGQMTAEDKRMVADACTQARDALNMGAEAMGCPL